MAACRSCGARIRWARVQTSGRTMPLDGDPDPTGNIARIGEDDDGVPLVAVVGPPRPDGGLVGDEYAGRRFRSHFQTCPNAKKHRRR